jgi:hypothetical protein
VRKETIIKRSRHLKKLFVLNQHIKPSQHACTEHFGRRTTAIMSTFTWVEFLARKIALDSNGRY